MKKIKEFSGRNWRSAALYFSISLVVGVWWWVAFSPPPPSQIVSSHSFAPPTLEEPFSRLSLLDRSLLSKALAGNFSLMRQLIVDWELDARLLEAEGVENVQHLSQEKFWHSQLLGRDLLYPPKKSTPKILPQTYAAASILLSIADLEQIVALPSGLRQQTQLYSEEITRQIPLDTDRYNTEKIFQALPTVAFVSANYSHPSTLQALSDQGMKIFPIDQLSTLQDIQQAIQQIGEISENAKKAEMLNLFIEAAFAALENRYRFSSSAKGVYLSYNEQFYQPSAQATVFDLLKRLKLLPQAPLYDRERLITQNPDFLIISTANSEPFFRYLSDDTSLHSLKAVQNRKIALLDDEIQQTPSQYIVLAYFDLLQALMRASFQ